MTIEGPPMKSSLLGPGGALPKGERFGVAVVRTLTEAIVTGELEPEETLPTEAQLTIRFGVSRTVIRESLKRLEEKGLVSGTQGSGTSVRSERDWNLLDPVVLSAMIEHDDALGILDELTKVRALLEASMAAEAAVRIDPESMNSLSIILGEMRASIADHDRFIDADRRFHALVMEASENRLAPSIARTLLNRASESSRFHGEDPDDLLSATLAAHEAIYAAIRAADAGAAQRAMYEHIQQSWLIRRPPTH